MAFTSPPFSNSSKTQTSEITIPINKLKLQGALTIPPDATSLVIFSHGSGSSRFSKRNNYVAEQLNKEKIATLLTDLLTANEDSEEDSSCENRFNIGLLTERLISITYYVCSLPDLKDLPIGYFGASTGAASALKAAAKLDNMISAVVSRGGRPDLAMSSLDRVKAPTLLIIGSLDKKVLAWNEQAYSMLECEKEIQIVDGASHLFEEPGKLEEVAFLAKDWFKKYVGNPQIKEHAIQR